MAGRLLPKLWLIMRLTLVLMIASLMQVSAASFGQKVTIAKANASLLSVLKEVRTQTGYNFLITDDQIEKSRSISLEMKRAPLEQVLAVIFSNQPLACKIENKTIVVIDRSAPQPPASTPEPAAPPAVDITGVVLDEKGEPLQGVTIRHKESGNSVTTNAKGEYHIDLAEVKGTLVFSYVGYQAQELPLNDRTRLDVSMKAVVGGLNEVVVVGYGTQAKSNVSNAITKVSTKEIAASPAANLGAGLAGRISGVTINARGGEPGAEQVEVYIRGKSTSGDASPLYVIDGIVRDYSGFSYLNPNEIESISVLKDASAAIYGSRAANGVLLITTKRGATGKPTITLDYDHGLSQQMRVPESADAYTYASMANLENRIKGLPEPYTADDLALYQNGKDPLNHPNTKWQDVIFKNWSAQDRANVGVSGGGKDSKYFVSAGYLGANSPFLDGFTYNKQYSIRSNLDFNVTDDLRLSLDLSARKRDVVNTQFDWAHIYLGLPTINAIYPNGLIAAARGGNSPVLMARDANYGYTNTQDNTFFGTLSLDWKLRFVKGLSIQANYAYDNDNNYIKTWGGVTYVYVLNQQTGQYEKRLNPVRATPSLDVYAPQTASQTSNIKLSYKQKFAGRHTIDAFVGFEQNSTQGTNLQAGRTAFVSGALQELFAGSADKQLQYNNDFSTRTGRQNVFGRAQYSYLDRYNIQFQFRYDGSQNFPPGKRYGFFPGVSGNWNIGNEAFMRNVTAVDYLKLRASYGEMGNDKVGAYQYLTAYSYGSNYVFNGTSAQGLVQANAPNPNITWEVAKTTDIGLEFGILKGIINGEIDYFYTKRSNILATRNASVPTYTGLTLPAENIGRVQNSGIELTLSHSNKIGRNFRYTVSGNMTYAKSKVLFQDETPGIPEWQRYTGNPIAPRILYEATGVFNDLQEVAKTAHRDGAGPGDLIIRDVNGDGVINSLDQVTQPYNSFPQIVYGLNFRFGYKAFELLLGFQGQARSTISRFNPYPYDPIGWGDFPTYLSKDVWSPENPNGSKPKPGLTSALQMAGTTYNYASADFLKLKTIELSYNLPSKLLSGTGLKGARAYLSGSNLFFIKDHLKAYGLDPEVTNAGWGYSQNRLINVGASVSF